MADQKIYRLLQKAIEQHRRWLEERAEFTEKLAHSFIDKSFALGGFDAIKTLPGSLQQLAHVLAARGMIQVLDGDSSGWAQIDRSVLYHQWAILLRSDAFFAQASLGQFRDVPGLEADLSIAANLFCYAVATQARDLEHSMSKILVRALSSNTLSEHFSRVSAFESFVLRLIWKLNSEPLPETVEQRNLGPYSEVIAHWDHGLELTKPLELVCDYHCKNMSDKGRNDRTPEFTTPPFDLLPCEIAAVYKIRQRLGLDTPDIEHPLLSTPLAQMSMHEAQLTDDDLTLRVQRLYAEVSG
jgi:hypothetical protein